MNREHDSKDNVSHTTLHCTSTDTALRDYSSVKEFPMTMATTTKTKKLNQVSVTHQANANFFSYIFFSWKGSGNDNCDSQSKKPSKTPRPTSIFVLDEVNIYRPLTYPTIDLYMHHIISYIPYPNILVLCVYLYLSLSL